MSRAHTRALALAIATTIVTSSTTATAGSLKDALDGMFMANATAARAYSSQTRGGLIGGSLALRAPISSINLLAFDPPRMNAGCGGIDLYGGSFSFLNGAQLTALFRQIAANAAGAAFMLAIQKIQPDLANLMGKFQSSVQAWNSLFKNTCSIANQAVKMVASTDTAAAQLEEKKATLDTAMGRTGDFFDSLGAFFSGSPGGKTVETAVDIKNGLLPIGGNRTWRALKTSKADQYLGAPGSTGTTSNRMREVLMSVIGTRVERPAGNSGEKPSTQLYMPVITDLKLLVDGAAPIKIMSCGTDYDHCLDVDPDVDLPATEFEGVRGYVKRMLLGAKDATSPQSGSILAKLRGCGVAKRAVGGAIVSAAGTVETCAMTAPQQTFIEAIPVPVIGIIKKVQHIDGGVAQLQDEIVNMTADYMATYLMRAIVKAATQVWSAAGDVEMPNEAKPTMDGLVAQMIQWERSRDDNLDRLLKLEKFTRLIAQTNPNLIAGAGR